MPSEKKIEKKRSVTKQDLSKFTILIVDDEEDLRDATVRDFKKKGFHVLTAESGNSAYKVIESQKVDLVVSDIRMPDGDGVFLLKIVCSLPVKIPVILITGFADYEESDCIAIGALNVFTKPFNRAKLMDSVMDALLKKR
jgi:DNA-binding NtrC family response regulator